MAANIDPHEILQVSSHADRVVIEAAYRALMKHHFPNGIPPGENQIAKTINEAHRILTNASELEKFEREAKNLPGKVVGEYRILEQIAEGGFAFTYKGEHVLTGMPVCIKFCVSKNPAVHKILIDEAAAVWDLRHYAIPSMRSMFTLNGGMALVMSYIPGPTLQAAILKKGRIEPEHVAWIAERILNALKYLHFHGVVHGDVKPLNIILQPEEHMAVLVDYGLASVKQLVATEKYARTKIFLAPEQEKEVNLLLPESDLYSLGITMLYALSGNLDMAIARQIPSSTPDALTEFITKLIRREVLARPNWEKEDLCETISQVRQKAFGRTSSNMLPLTV